MRGGGEVLSASAAAPALGDEQCLIGGDHLAEDFAGVRVAHFGPRRNRQINILRRFPTHVLSLPVLPSLRAPMRVVAIVEKCREVGIDLHIDTAATAPIAAIGAALGHELFTTEGTRTRASRSRRDMDDNSIYEHRCLTDPGREPGEKDSSRGFY